MRNPPNVIGLGSRCCSQDYATAAAGHRFQSAASDSQAWSIVHVSVEVSADVVLAADESDATWPNAARCDAAAIT